MQLLHYFYEEDVLSQESIQKWHSKSSLYEAGAEIRRLVSPYSPLLNILGNKLVLISIIAGASFHGLVRHFFRVRR